MLWPGRKAPGRWWIRVYPGVLTSHGTHQRHRWARPGFRGCRRRVDRWLAIAVMGLALLASEPAVAALRYQEISADRRSVFDWQLTPGDPLQIVVTQESQRFRTWVLADGATLRWELTDGHDTHLTVERVGPRLVFRGVWRGSDLERQVDIDTAPWFQALSFSLRGIRHLPQRRCTFWTVRADTLEVLKMSALAAGRENAPSPGGSTEAFRVRVTLEGWRSALWHADYWFRARDGLFIRYRSVHGPPGTPATEVELLP
jgi:hypothetical protein